MISWFRQTMSESEELASYHQWRNAHARGGYQRTITLARDLRQLKRNLN